MKSLPRAFGVILVAIAISSAAHAAPPTAEGAREWYKRVVRVQAISRKIFESNLDFCPVKRDDFGFMAVSPDPEANDVVRSALIEGLGLGDGSTTLAVFPGGPAAAGGLQVGDSIIEINGAKWSPAPKDRKAFSSAMAGASALHLVVKRQEQEVQVTVPAQKICAADVWLTPRAKVNALANGMNIVVEGGLEQLLDSDDELAWVIAHEAAHVFLGHTAADRAADLKNDAIRSQMEREADALSVRLMLQAGFAAEAAFSAQPKLASASRGPVSRLLDLHGPYMGTRERTEFLMSETESARSELLSRSPSR